MLRSGFDVGKVYFNMNSKLSHIRNLLPVYVGANETFFESRETLVKQNKNLICCETLLRLWVSDRRLLSASGAQNWKYITKVTRSRFVTITVATVSKEYVE